MTHDPRKTGDKGVFGPDRAMVLVGYCVDPPLGRFAIPPCDDGYSRESIPLRAAAFPFNRALDLFAIGDALVMLPAEF
jgi:hypothetical protein